MNRRAKAALVAVGLLLGAEAVLRLAVPAAWLTFAWERPDGMLQQDPASRTYLPRPGTAAHNDDGPYRWSYRVNAQGLREDDEVPADRPGAFRVLALGDSWIFGISTDQARTLDRGLEALLGARLGRPVEVINAGVPGAGAFDTLLRWRELGPRFRVDGVLVGEPHNYRRQAAVEGARSTWLAGGAPYLPSYVYLGLRRLLLPLTRAELREATPDAVAATLADVRRLAEEAAAGGLGVWVGVWPSTLDGALGRRPEATLDLGRWREALAGTGAKVTGHRLDERSCWGWEDHSHPSESGYRVLAEVLAPLIAGEPEPAGLLSSPDCAAVPGRGPTKPDAPPMGAGAPPGAAPGR